MAQITFDTMFVWAVLRKKGRKKKLFSLELSASPQLKHGQISHVGLRNRLLKKEALNRKIIRRRRHNSPKSMMTPRIAPPMSTTSVLFPTIPATSKLRVGEVDSSVSASSYSSSSSSTISSSSSSPALEQK